ncbi:MAG: hypothetical protein R3320_00320 [Nitriliruptorales bacterium]|nr:hypothetical protein [Nitriliruptorales bacterium]
MDRREERVRQRGSAAIELVAGTGLLLLPAVLLVLSIPGWAQAKTAAEIAAREAARSVALAADPESVHAAATGRETARSALQNHGHVPVAEPSFRWSHAEVRGGLAQSQVEATVTVRMPALTVPFIGSWMSFDWSATHTEPIDIYRSRP